MINSLPVKHPLYIGGKWSMLWDNMIDFGEMFLENAES